MSLNHKFDNLISNKITKNIHLLIEDHFPVSLGIMECV